MSIGDRAEARVADIMKSARGLARHTSDLAMKDVTSKIVSCLPCTKGIRRKPDRGRLDETALLQPRTGFWH